MNKYKVAESIVNKLIVDLKKRMDSGVKWDVADEKTHEEIVYKKLDKARFRGKKKGIFIYQPIGLKGKVSEEALAEIRLHEEALQAYQACDWVKAKKNFLELKKSALAAVAIGSINPIDAASVAAMRSGLGD